MWFYFTCQVQGLGSQPLLCLTLMSPPVFSRRAQVLRFLSPICLEQTLKTIFSFGPEAFHLIENKTFNFNFWSPLFLAKVDTFLEYSASLNFFLITFCLIGKMFTFELRNSNIKKLTKSHQKVRKIKF